MVKGNVGNALYALTNADEMRAQRALHETYNDIFETDNGKITVDTCWVADCDWYETGIKVHDEWYIVQKNIDGSELKAVHNKWVAIMKKDPFKQLRDMRAEDGDLDE